MNIIDDNIEPSQRIANLCMQRKLSADDLKRVEHANNIMKQSDKKAKSGDALAASELLEDARKLVEQVESSQSD